MPLHHHFWTFPVSETFAASGDETIKKKKGQGSLFAAQEIVKSSTTAVFQICHLSHNRSYRRNVAREKKKIIIGVFIFSIISSPNLCQQNQNAFLSHVRKCSSGPNCGGLRDRLRWIRSKWVLCFCVNKRLLGFEVINHKKNYSVPKHL